MRKILFLLFAFFILSSMAHAVTVNITQASTLVTSHYSMTMDSITGKFYAANGYTSHSNINVYNSAADFASNTVSSTRSLSSPYYGTYMVALNGKLYARTSGSTIGRWDLTTGTQELTKSPFTDMSTNGFNWGGASYASWFYDGNSMYVLGRNTSNGYWQLNRMDNDLNVVEKKTFNGGTLGYAIMLNGKLFTSSNYASNTINYVFDFATGSYSSVNYTFSPSSGAYWGDTFFDPTANTIYMNSVSDQKVYKITNASTVFNAPANIQVPEPGAWMLLLLGLSFLWKRSIR